ncbi:hypothetical protein AG1IA_08465 [Rhizoctonia solani AG-1 IA]|uniref:Uncharacterized protein n=1 Tax=Thanatephorus cucumeris (strain AG1-IA) TaxID=983506 RepID=L8WH36_THACA|nr:hypothetical protein AG1IA_08465 [Rhizoctonia solani AG-1 IA]
MSTATPTRKPLPGYYQFGAGAFAGVTEICIFYPLGESRLYLRPKGLCTKAQSSWGKDVVKTRMQLDTGKSPSMLTSFKNIIRQEGYVAGRLYRGLVPPLLLEAPKRAVKCEFNNTLLGRRREERKGGRERGSDRGERFLGQGIHQEFTRWENDTGVEYPDRSSGGMNREQGIIGNRTTPLMGLIVFAYRLQDKTSKYAGPMDVVRSILRQHGPLGLYAGMESTFWRIADRCSYHLFCTSLPTTDLLFGAPPTTVPDLHVTTIHTLRSRLPKTPQAALLNNFVSGAAGGFVGTALNTPFDVSEARIADPGRTSCAGGGAQVQLDVPVAGTNSSRRRGCGVVQGVRAQGAKVGTGRRSAAARCRGGAGGCATRTSVRLRATRRKRKRKWKWKGAEKLKSGILNRERQMGTRGGNDVIDRRAGIYKERARERQNGRRMSDRQANFTALPPEVIQDIVVWACGGTVVGPPTELAAMLAVSRRTNSALKVEQNPGLHARIFDVKFDSRAPTRRFQEAGQPLTALSFAHELRRRWIGLKRIRGVSGAGKLSVCSEEHEREDQWMIYLMFLESDGRNYQQLHWARVTGYVRTLIRDKLMPSPRPGYMHESTSRAIGLWLMCRGRDPARDCADAYHTPSLGTGIAQVRHTVCAIHTLESAQPRRARPWGRSCSRHAPPFSCRSRSA